MRKLDKALHRLVARLPFPFLQFMKKLHKALHILICKLCNILKFRKGNEESFIYSIDFPPADSELFFIDRKIKGAIHSAEEITGMAMSAGGRHDMKVKIWRVEDIQNAKGKELKYHSGFESNLSIAECLSGKDNIEISLNVSFRNNARKEVKIPIHSCYFRKKEKRKKIIPLLVCPLCHASLEKQAESFYCASCNLHYPIRDNSINFLTRDLQSKFSIISTENISSWTYDERIVEIIEQNPNSIFLDCGSGYRKKFYSNVINYEIIDYPSTDIVGIGEKLPFASNSLDGVFSVAVLEHVKNPFLCANEITRVLKPGGVLFCAVPLLQPVHAYPHHYYNMTAEGLANLFNQLNIKEQYVPLSLHPMTSIQWILLSYAQGLPELVREKFANMTVHELVNIGSFEEWKQRHIRFIHELKKEKWAELAGGNVIVAYKKK